MIKHVSPIVQLSAAALPDIDWTMSLLKHCGAYLDWISLHGYWDMLPEKMNLQIIISAWHIQNRWTGRFLM